MNKKVTAHVTSELGISPAISAGADSIERGCHASDTRSGRGLTHVASSKHRFYNGDIKSMRSIRQTTHRSICNYLCVMQDLLRYIDLDYYRSAQVLIVRAEIAQLRRQSSTVARAEQPRKTPIETLLPIDAFDQTA